MARGDGKGWQFLLPPGLVSAGKTQQTQMHCKGLLGTPGRVSCQEEELVDTSCEGYCQAEERVLSGFFGLWDS